MASRLHPRFEVTYDPRMRRFDFRQDGSKRVIFSLPEPEDVEALLDDFKIELDMAIRYCDFVRRQQDLTDFVENTYGNDVLTSRSTGAFNSGMRPMHVVPDQQTSSVDGEDAA